MGKTTISVECVDQRLYVVDRPLIASGGQDENAIAFKFCSLWAGFGITAVFYRNPDEVYNVAVANNACTIPNEVLAAEGKFYFGVFGVNGKTTRTSEVIEYNVVKGAAIPGSKPAAPTPDIYDQIVSQLSNIQNSMVLRSGDNIPGKLIMKSGSGVRNGDDGWVAFAFETDDGQSRGNMMVSTNNVWHVNVKETGASHSDRYQLPAPTTGLAADNWYRIHTSKELIAVEHGGTGVAQVADLMALVNNSFQVREPSSASSSNVFKLTPGIYHCEEATSLDQNYPIEQARATVEVIGQYRGTTKADDGYPNGYWFIRITYSNGDMYVNYRSWNKWTGWKKYAATSVATASE